MGATLGIDLASRPARTGIALVDWTPPRPRLEVLSLGVSPDGTVLHDKFLSTAARGLRFPLEGGEITKVGIDAPFGWPTMFTSALTNYAVGLQWPTGLDDDRGLLERRTTDRVVKAASTSNPLAVSVDKIGYCAMRCAVILSDLSEHLGRERVHRDGRGLVCEVYPDPALRHWGQESPAPLAPRSSYKGEARTEVRRDLLVWLASTIDLDDPRGLIAGCATRKEDDFIDALLCALVARAVELGQTLTPQPHEIDDASREGWIHLPTHSLSELTG